MNVTIVDIIFVNDETHISKIAFWYIAKSNTISGEEECLYCGVSHEISNHTNFGL